MLRKTIAFLVVGFAVMVAAGPVARASNVTLTLTLDPAAPGCVGCTLSGAGTYNLAASINSGDNFGISAYSIPIINVTSVLHRAPRANLVDDPDSGDSGAAGFTSFRTANNQTVIPGGFLVGASQDVFTPTPFQIRGFGQMASSFAAQVPPTATLAGVLQGDWAADVMLVEGAYATGAMPTVDFTNVNIRASAYGDASGTRLVPVDTIELIVVPPGGGGDEVAPLVGDFMDTAELNETIATTIVDSQGDPDPTWSDLQNFVFTPGSCGPDGCDPATPFAYEPQWNPATQAFSWNTQGATRGTYKWEVTAMNSAGSDTGMITIEVPFVPEPATVSLFGLALVGLAGLRRRG